MAAAATPAASTPVQYNPQAVLITGGLGFIGSNLVNHLVAQYPSIQFVNVDRLDYCASLRNIVVADHPNYRFVKGDLAAQDFVSHILEHYHIDTVLHLAAQSSVDHSEKNTGQHVLDNVVATHSLLEACRRYGRIRRFIHVSTDEVYGDQEDGKEADEASILMPNNVYSASKAAGEMLVRAYRVSHKLPIIVTRGNNCFGPRQYPEKIWPKFICQLLRGEKMTIHGKGVTKRNFLSVQDTVRAFELILFKGALGEIYNIGTNNELSVLEVADMVRQRITPEKTLDDVVNYVPDRVFNDTRYWITSDKLRQLGWAEQLDFTTALDEMVAWYRGHFAQTGLEHWEQGRV